MGALEAQIALNGLTQFGVVLAERVQRQFSEILRDPAFAKEVRELGLLIKAFPEDISLPCRVFDLTLLHASVGGLTTKELVNAAGAHARTCNTCYSKIDKLPEKKPITFVP